MRSLFTHARSSTHLSALHLPPSTPVSSSTKKSPPIPTLKNIAPRVHQAHYYWAANYQSYLIFSNLIDSAAKQPHPDTYLKIKAALISLMETIIDRGSSYSPDARAYKDLLKSHLQGLSTKQLQQLVHILKISEFNYIGHEVVYEMIEHNGRKKEREKMIALLAPNQLFSLLQELSETAEIKNSTHSLSPLPNNWNIPVRKTIFDATAIWKNQPCSNGAELILLKAAQDIAAQLGLSPLPDQVQYCTLNYQHSSVLLKHSTLQCDSRLQRALANQKNSTLTYLAPFERALRDVLELLLMKKMFGTEAVLDDLQPHQLHALRDNIDVVLNRTAPELTQALKLLARDVMQHASTFGHIHISPNGSGSGHSWIAPDFSIFPNNGDGRLRIAGLVFLQEAKQLAPAPKKITEKSVDFISPEKNENYFPYAEALKITVPVPADVLQQSAQRIKQEWIKDDVLYRSMSSLDGGDIRSCRVGVWQAVLDGMDTSTRQLFEHYHCGLPDPDSSAELWLRMQGFMQWLQTLAAQA